MGGLIAAEPTAAWTIGLVVLATLNLPYNSLDPPCDFLTLRLP
jgi:hypothetical protein